MPTKSLLTVVLLVSGCASATASIVMDQIGDDRSYTADGPIAASQDFEGSLDAYDVGFLDDFMVSDDRLITKIETVTGIFNNLPGAAFSQVRGWRIEIFSSPSIASTSLVGDVVSKWVSPHSVVLDTSWSSTSDLYALACIPTSIQLPNPGQYWISIIPQLDYMSSGQIGVVESAFPGWPGNNNSLQANPSGGMGFQGGLSYRNTNAAYRIEAVPEPASFGALALGSLLARRRAKSNRSRQRTQG